MSFRIPLPDDPFREYCFEKYGSIHNLIDKANNGEVVAQADLGLAYSEGFGDLLPRDYDKAIGWLTTAVNKGDESPVTLGKLGELLDRKGTSLYQRKAYEMYHRAAKQGCTNSQINLAEMYRCGVEGVVNEDIKEAFKWYKMAADEISNDSEPGEVRDLFNQTVKKLGDAVSGTKKRALKFLYKYYLEGDCPEGQPQPTKAVYYLTRAAELGDTEAQLNLGQIYLNGDCEQIKDASKAKRWLGKASANGDVLAKELLMKCDKMEDKGHSTSELTKEAFKQLYDIRMERLKQRLEANNHPFKTTQRTVLSEELLSEFEWSPTARIYLQAFRLLKQGLEILFKSNFADERGISFIARGYLTENSILQSFSHITLLLPEIFQLCEKSLQNNPSFFEGVVIAFAFPGYCGLKESNKTKKIDFKKVMCIRNLINFIQKAERNGPPADNAFRFDQCYSSWLHVLYDHLGGHYIINEKYEEAAEAFENSLKYCPTYFPSKRGLGYCLSSLYQLRFHSGKEDSARSEFRKEKQIAEKREVSKYRSWTTEQLGKAAKETLEEFLTEAPQCWKTYPNVCYYLAKLAFVNDDRKEIKKYYELGQDAEENRLPFFSPVNLPDKEMLSPFYHAFTSSPEPAKCGNKACTKKVKETDLKACSGCRTKKYCSKDCQKADWKEHKAACTVSKRGKAKDGT